jgi:hypothetical protein
MRPPTPDGGRGAAGKSATPAAAGFLAAPLAEALAVLPPRPGSLMDAPLSAGGCFVRPLPVDTTCAAAARRFFREALASLPIPSGLLHDGVTMASELAANTLHAQRLAAAADVARRASGGVPEIWLYLRGSGRACEIVCKVFDSARDWEGAAQTGLAKAPVDSVSGRGLQVVDGLSAGMWGCHPTLSRLGAAKTAGKAFWFALRVPPATLPDDLGRPRYGPDWLVDELEAMLSDRGMAAIVRADAGSISVLSISRHLTVWRNGPTISWRAASGSYQQLDLADLVDAAEQIVWAHEESVLAEEPGAPGGPVAVPDLAAS